MFCLMGLFEIVFSSCHYDPAVDDEYYLKNGLDEPIVFIKMDIDHNVYDSVTIDPGESALVYWAKGIGCSYFSQNRDDSGFMGGFPYCIKYSDGRTAYYGTEHPSGDSKHPGLKKYWTILENSSKKHRDEYVVEYTVDEVDYQYAVGVTANSY